jgi:hypothetical protein
MFDDSCNNMPYIDSFVKPQTDKTNNMITKTIILIDKDSVTDNNKNHAANSCKKSLKKIETSPDTNISLVTGEEGDHLKAYSEKLKKLCRIYGTKIITDKSTKDLAKNMAMLELDIISDQKIFTLVGNEETAKSKEFIKWKAAHDSMLASYRIKDTDCAAQDLKDARDLSGGKLSPCYDLYSKRISDLILKGEEG